MEQVKQFNIEFNRFLVIFNRLYNQKLVRGVTGLSIFILLWEFGSRFDELYRYQLPWIGIVPPPSSVIIVWSNLLTDLSYWQSWISSFSRVLSGFLAAVIVGVPFGLFLTVNRTIHDILYPPFELLRPIPPLAWVPVAIIFWPTQEMSITFVIFIGAFYVIVLNVLGGAQNLDVRFTQAARSMGASNWVVFKRITLPGVLPSIFTGCAVGMGITWEVVVAAEMISGGDGGGRGGSGGGLGFFIWNSYVGGSYSQIIVGMISIGIAGYLSSTLIRIIGKLSTPWLHIR